MANEQYQKVCLGSKVVMAVNGIEQTWEIASEGNSDIENGKISIEAPLTKLIFGFKVGDKINGKLVGREVLIEVKRVLKV